MKLHISQYISAIFFAFMIAGILLGSSKLFTVTASEDTSASLSVPDDSYFRSCRLVVLDESKELTPDPAYVIAQYDRLYLLRYPDAAQTRAAYLSYLKTGVLAEPDVVVDAASPEESAAAEETSAAESASDQEKSYATQESDLEITEDSNPLDTLAQESSDASAANEKDVIALIDTGVSENVAVLDRISLIDDRLSGNGHADRMAEAVIDQNPGAKILSIRALGDDGCGTVSSVVAAIEYAIEQDVSVINLSLYAKSNLANSVLESEIQKAAEAGITVVGAAGNDNADARDYVPGFVSEAYIIGACSAEGIRISGSNYGNTVDYNVVADSTSEAAAKFSGYVSKYGLTDLPVNQNLIFSTDYAGSRTDNSPEASSESTDSSVQEDTELAQTADSEIPEPTTYPACGSISSVTEKLWIRDTAYDFTLYNPYGDLAELSCTEEPEEIIRKAGSTCHFTYLYRLKEDSSYSWKLSVLFKFVEDRTLSTVGSELTEKLMPLYLTQERNAGYGGTVPAMSGDTVEGRQYTVLKDDESFDLTGLWLDYNPLTFKLNEIADDGGFDIHTPGTYKVILSVSHFMYYDYPWYVKCTVTVIDPSELDPGLYITCEEPTLMLQEKGGDVISGYGNLIRIAEDHRDFRVSCMDESFEIAIKSSDPAIEAEAVCSVTEEEETQTKSVSVSLIDSENPCIFSLYRTGYEATKQFTGGGWQDSSLSEPQLEDFTQEEFTEYEQELSNESEQDQLLRIAADWITVAESSCEVRVDSGDQNVTNRPSSPYRFPGSNRGTVLVTEKKSTIESWLVKNGYTIDLSKLKNFKVKCVSGHSRMAMKIHTYYKTTLHMYVQKKGTDYRLKLYVSFQPPDDENCSDAAGRHYQKFAGTSYVSVKNVCTLYVRKALAYPWFVKSLDRYSGLDTAFGIYTAKDCSEDSFVEAIVFDSEDDTNGIGSCELDPGTYYVKEIRRITGFAENTWVYGPVTIQDTDTSVNLWEKVDPDDYPNMNDKGYIYNYPFYYTGLLVKKYDSTGQETSVPVADAIFKIEYSAEYNDWETVATWYFKTDSQGEIRYDASHLQKTWTDAEGTAHQSSALYATSDGTASTAYPRLPTGFLRAAEVEAPTGYSLNSKVYYAEIQAEKDANGKYTNAKAKLFFQQGDAIENVIKVPDTPSYTRVGALISKEDNKGNPVSGVIFKACFYESDSPKDDDLKKIWYLKSDEEGRINLDTSHLLESWNSQSSDSLYSRDGEIVLPNGYLTLQEVETPADYVLDQTVYDWNITGKELTLQPVYNKLEPAAIHLIKLDTDGKTPLQNVTFSLYFKKAAYPLNDKEAKKYAPLLKEGETCEAVTDSKGMLDFENLDQGEYVLTEIKTVPGHTLLKDPVEVTLPLTMTEEEANEQQADTDQGKWNTEDRTWHFYKLTCEVTNSASFEIPATGQTGKWIWGYLGAGFLFILTICVMGKNIFQKQKNT